MSRSRLVIEPNVRLHSSKNMLLVFLFVSSLFSGCLQESSSSSISVETELIWIRAEGDVLATIDMNAELTVRDIFNGSVIASQRLNGTLIDSGTTHCDLVASHPSNTDVFSNQSCLMVNGDFSSDEGLRRLHLNICLVRHENKVHWQGRFVRYDSMEVVVCEFLDFSAKKENLVGEVFDESDLTKEKLSLIGRNVSENTYAITYPTESGTIRLFSNNSMVNLDTGKEYLIPIPVSCDDIWAYNCSNWPSTQEEIQSDPDIWHWYSPMIPPYPSENGTRWYVTYCSNAAAKIVVYDMIQNENGVVSWMEQSGFNNAAQKIPYWSAQGCERNIPVIGSAGSGATYAGTFLPNGDWTLEPQQHHFRASWFWYRLWFRCDSVNHPNGIEGDWNYSSSYSSNPIWCGTFQNYGGVDEATDFLGPFDFERFVVWDEQKGDWGEEEFLEVLYADGTYIRVAPDNIGLLETGDQPSDWGGISPIAYLIGLLAVSVVFSSNVNTFVANTSDKYSKKKEMGTKIRSLHYSQWESRDGPSVNFGEGLVAAVGGLLYLSLYVFYLVLVAAVYLAMAYLIVAGTFLILTVGAVGLICFIPFLFLMPFFG